MIAFQIIVTLMKENISLKEQLDKINQKVKDTARGSDGKWVGFIVGGWVGFIATF